jgi:cytochrome b561
MAHGESTTDGWSAAPQRWSAPSIALHWLSAALKHHFLDRDDILRRMFGVR